MTEATQTEKSKIAETPEDGYFLLGFWCNAYRSNDREYFFAGPFADRKDAVATGKRLQQRGQPRTFRDWGVGSNKTIRGVEAFKIAAAKVDLNPNVSDLYFR